MISSIKQIIIKNHLLISLSVANLMKIQPNVTFSFKIWLIYEISLFGQGKITENYCYWWVLGSNSHGIGWYCIL